MKRKTKAIVFIGSMLITLGSLFAFVGHRHSACGMHSHRYHSETMGQGCEQGHSTSDSVHQSN